MTVILDANAGPYVVNLTDYLPAPRHDNTAWTQVRVDEAATKAGTTTATATGSLPAPTDPAHPDPISIEFRGATLPAGWYLVTLLDASDNEQPFDWLLNGPSYTATRDDVARKLKARTRNPQGALVGTFDNTTTISGTTVDEMIADATAMVAARIGTSIPDDKLWMARRAVAIRAAMDVELSFTPEQTAGDETAYGRLEQQYEEAIAALTVSLRGDEPGAAGFASVPVVSPTMTAWNTPTEPTVEQVP